MPDREHGNTATALAQLFNANYDFVWRFARSLVGDAGAEDVAQEVFMIAGRRLQDLTRGSDRAWLASITRNVARNRVRGGRRRTRHLATVTEPAAEVTPEEWMQLRQAADELDRFIAHLSPKLREAFVLVDVEGLKGVDAADVLSLPLRTVYSRVRLAREQFTAWVAERMEMPR